MKNFVLVLVVVAGCGGLSHLQPPPRVYRAAPLDDREQCAFYDRSQLGWSLSAIVFGFLGGSSGGVTALIPEDTSKYATGGVSLGLAVWSGISTYLTTYYTKRYAMSCTANVGGK